MTAIMFILLVLTIVVSSILVLLGLPGTFTSVFAYLIIAFINGFKNISMYDILILLIVAIIAEVIEFISGVIGAKKMGSVKSGIYGAIAGGFILAFLFSFILPIIGTFIGMILGTFLGAFIGDYLQRKNYYAAVRSGLGALLGKVFAIVLKVSIVIISGLYIMSKVLS